MNKINIFKENKKIDLPTLIDSRLLICANSGGGKSYAVRKLLEETSDKVMSIVLDVEGEFKTFREKYDYLLIGRDGDVELNMRSAELLPERLLSLNVSTIIDISDLQKHDRIKYVKDFLESLMSLKRDLWKPCLIILDEAHLLCGQQEKQDSFLAVIDLMTRGRKRCYCGVLCSQRIAKLHKDAVAECNNYLIGRTGLDIDMKRASEILGFTNKQDMLSLRNLEPGEFYVFGTAISKEIEKIHIAEVITTHPKVGMDVKNTISAPTNKIKNLLSELNDLPKEVEQQRKDKDSLIKEVSDLKRQLVNKPKEVIKEEKVIEVTDKVALEKAYERGALEMQNKYESIVKDLKISSSHIETSLRKLLSDGAKILESKSFSIVADKPKIIVPNFESSRRVHTVGDRGFKSHRGESSVEKKVISPTTQSGGSTPQYPRIAGDGSANNLGKCEKMIYSFLYANPNRSFTSSQIGAVTGYSHNSGSFGNALSKLRIADLIEAPNKEQIKIKDINSDYVITDKFSVDNVLNILDKCQKEIYQVLSYNVSKEFTIEELASSTESNYSVSGSFMNAISRLNTLGLIIKNGKTVKFNEELLDI